MEMTSMKIKLVLPKTDGTNGEIKFYACSTCGKKFGCGKALGGHKTVHLPKIKSPNDLKLKQKNWNSQLVIVDQKLKCPNCDKAFASKKSLYGHMGHHAKKNLRGMKPPVPVAENQDSQLVAENQDSQLVAKNQDSQLVVAKNQGSQLVVAKNQGSQLVVSEFGPSETKDLVNEVNPRMTSNFSLPHWSMRGKRGKTTKALALIDPVDESAEILMIENPIPEANEKLPVKKRRFDLPESSNTGRNGGAPMHENLDKPLENELALVIPVVNNVDFGIQIESKNQFPCDKCDMSFKSSRGLGGHRAYHRIKERGAAAILAITAFADSGVKNVKKRREGGDSSALIYQCQSCDKMFVNGQALGGHKRHCKGLATENALVPFRGRGNVTGNQRRVFMVDLNELPPPEFLE